MTRHIHADLMMQYAQDALETDKPWERWEIAEADSNCPTWRSPDSALAWWPAYQYRRKPKPYEPTLLDQALELEIEATKIKCRHYNDQMELFVQQKCKKMTMNYAELIEEKESMYHPN